MGIDAARQDGADKDEGHAELPKEHLEGANVGARLEHADAKAADLAAAEVLHVGRHPRAAQRAEGGAQQLGNAVEKGFEPRDLQEGG